LVAFEYIGFVGIERLRINARATITKSACADCLAGRLRLKSMQCLVSAILNVVTDQPPRESAITKANPLTLVILNEVKDLRSTQQILFPGARQTQRCHPERSEGSTSARTGKKREDQPTSVILSAAKNLALRDPLPL
jgi:hypothetical protein